MNWFTRICTTLAFGLLAATQALAAPGHGLLLQEGKLWGWGNNQYGQLGTGQPAEWPQARVLSLPSGLLPTAAVAGGRHSVALDRSGRVWAWGDNSSGQLGQGHARALSVPVQVQGLPVRAVMLAAGQQHTVALLADGTVWAWGANTRGQLGSGAIDAFAPARDPAPVPLPSNARGSLVKAVVAGDDFSLARLADGRVMQWGSGAAQPVLVADLSTVQRIRARGTLAMAQDAKGRFWQWQAGEAPTAKPRPSTARAYAELAVPPPPGALGTLVAATPSVQSAVTPGAKIAVTPGAKVTVTPGSTRGPSPASSQARPGVDEAPAVRTPPGSRVEPGMTTAGGQPLAPATTAPRPLPAAAPGAQIAVTSPPQITATPGSTRGPSPPPPQARPGVDETPPARAEAPARVLQISGRVLLAGSRTDGLEQAQVSAEGAPCSATDAQGRFSCTVPAGWSGRLVVRKNNFRISPSALSYRNLQGDASGQDFAAVYDPR